MPFNAGDFTHGSTVRIPFNTNAQDGASITIATNGTLKIYKNSSATERTSLAGVTLSEDFDAHTGQHLVEIETSNNDHDGFYASGNDYFVAITGSEIDGQTVNHIFGAFSIENRTTAALQAILDKLDTMLEADDTDFRFTEEALANGPTGSGLDADGVRAALGMDAADLDAQLAALPTAAENAAAVEAAILDEGDATALLAAIAAKVEEFLINEGDATATIDAIATACNAAIVAGTVGSGITSILEDTGTTLPATLATIGGKVDDILTDTGTTLPAVLGTPSNLGSGATLAANVADLFAQQSNSIAWGELSVKSTEGDFAQVTAWLERNGQRYPISTSNPTAFTSDHTTDTLTSAAHGLSNGDVLLLSTDDTLPDPLEPATPYYVVNKTDNTFQLAATAGGDAIELADNGTGPHSWHHPTATITVREHGAAAGLENFIKTLTAADITNDMFEGEQADPGFNDDRQYELTVRITDGDLDITTTQTRTVIG